MEARLGGWQAHLLLRGDRLVLLKAVLSAIPIYFILVFRMPVGVRQRLKGAMRHFFWRGPSPTATRGGRSSPSPWCVGLYPKAAWEYATSSTPTPPSLPSGYSMLCRRRGTSSLWCFVRPMGIPWTPLHGRYRDVGTPLSLRGCGNLSHKCYFFFRPQLGDGTGYSLWQED